MHDGFLLVAQTAKNLPAMQKTWVLFLGREDPLEEGMAVFWWLTPPEASQQGSLGPAACRVGRVGGRQNHKAPEGCCLSQGSCIHLLPARMSPAGGMGVMSPPRRPLIVLIVGDRGLGPKYGHGDLPVGLANPVA